MLPTEKLLVFEALGYDVLGGGLNRRDPPAGSEESTNHPSVHVSQLWLRNLSDPSKGMMVYVPV
jgi:hypothetical protein